MGSSLEGTVALVTGASSGIGPATAPPTRRRRRHRRPGCPPPTVSRFWSPTSRPVAPRSRSAPTSAPTRRRRRSPPPSSGWPPGHPGQRGPDALGPVDCAPARRLAPHGLRQRPRLAVHHPRRPPPPAPRRRGQSPSGRRRGQCQLVAGRVAPRRSASTTRPSSASTGSPNPYAKKSPAATFGSASSNRGPS